MQITINEIIEKEHARINILASSSKGNAYLVNNKMLIDIGVPFTKISDYVNEIELILISHRHSDHIKIPTLKKAMEQNENIKLMCNEDVFKFLKEKEFSTELFKRIEILKTMKRYQFTSNNIEYKFIPIHLYHDVENNGFIFAYKNLINDKLVTHLHGTDTHTTKGIKGIANRIDVLTFECNYTPNYAKNNDEEKRKNGAWSNYQNVLNTHLSANEFVKLAKYACHSESIIRPCHMSGENFDTEEFKEIFKEK